MISSTTGSPLTHEPLLLRFSFAYLARFIGFSGFLYYAIYSFPPRLPIKASGSPFEDGHAGGTPDDSAGDLIFTSCRRYGTIHISSAWFALYVATRGTVPTSGNICTSSRTRRPGHH